MGSALAIANVIYNGVWLTAAPRGMAQCDAIASSVMCSHTQGNEETKMSRHSGSSTTRRPALRALAVQIAAVVGCVIPAVGIAATVHVVTSCVDQNVLVNCQQGDDGTLRHAYQCAGDGDTVDLSQLTCSTVSLAGPLNGAVGNVTVNGPGRDRLIIDARGRFRALSHSGSSSQTLTVNDLSITNGVYVNSYGYHTGGGCINSSGNVALNRVNLSHCYATATKDSTVSSPAAGGALFATNKVTLSQCNVTDNVASTTGITQAPQGGAIFGYEVDISDSTLSGNAAVFQSEGGSGGAILAVSMMMSNSTVSGNEGSIGGGINCQKMCKIYNSTISGNTAHLVNGGIQAQSAHLSNDTIVGNSSDLSSWSFQDNSAGVYAFSVTLESNIIAGNTAAGALSDLALRSALTVSGSHNLIVAASVGIELPADTIAVNPLLGPLQSNGGKVKTHALRRESLARDRGSNPKGFASDSRGGAFRRTVGSSTDIGAFEYDPDRIFFGGFD
jgi:hypothetical protein